MTQHIVASWTCHVINAVHSAVAYFLSPDQSSEIRFHTNWETTLKTVVLGSHWKHCFSASTSVPSELEVYLYTTMCYINRRFTYLLTYLLFQHMCTFGSQTELFEWWCVLGNVYNMTAYMAFHPGGVSELMRGAGIDCSEIFDEVHHQITFHSFIHSYIHSFIYSEIILYFGLSCYTL